MITATFLGMMTAALTAAMTAAVAGAISDPDAR
jgi:hypothetical protein